MGQQQLLRDGLITAQSPAKEPRPAAVWRTAPLAVGTGRRGQNRCRERRRLHSITLQATALVQLLLEYNE